MFLQMTSKHREAKSGLIHRNFLLITTEKQNIETQNILKN